MKHLIGHPHAMVLSILNAGGPMLPTDVRNAWFVKVDERMPRGTLYVTLQRLEGLKLVKSAVKKGDRRRLYRIMPKGRKALVAYKQWMESV